MQSNYRFANWSHNRSGPWHQYDAGLANPMVVSTYYPICGAKVKRLPFWTQPYEPDTKREKVCEDCKRVAAEAVA